MKWYRVVEIVDEETGEMLMNRQKNEKITQYEKRTNRTTTAREERTRIVTDEREPYGIRTILYITGRNPQARLEL